MKNDGLLWINPDFYAAYLDSARNPPPGATRVGTQGWTWVGPPRTERQRAHEQASAHVDKLLLETFRGANVTMCTVCVLKQQIGTIWCYKCARPMISKDPLPLSHETIKDIVCSRPPDHTALRGNAPNAPVTVGNLTWDQRMLDWRRSAFKKKDARGNYLYRYTEWPISARWQWDLQWRSSSDRMSQQYFGRNFTWEMAQEADCIAWRLHQAEKAAQRNKGKGKGQPDTDARPQTFDV